MTEDKDPTMIDCDLLYAESMNDALPPQCHGCKARMERSLLTESAMDGEWYCEVCLYDPEVQPCLQPKLNLPTVSTAA